MAQCQRMKCECGQCGFNYDDFIDGQARWFIRNRNREVSHTIWYEWKEKRDEQHMRDLTRRIKEIRNEKR